MTEERTTSATGGEKGRKPQEMAWLDPLALLELGAVARMGADKYGDHNFRKGYEWSKCYNALHRHLAAFWSGEDRDPESGLPHLAHAAWHCLTLISFMREHPEYDDRYINRTPNTDSDISGQVGVYDTIELQAATNKAVQQAFDWPATPELTDDRRNLLA